MWCSLFPVLANAFPILYKFELLLLISIFATDQIDWTYPKDGRADFGIWVSKTPASCLSVERRTSCFQFPSIKLWIWQFAGLLQLNRKDHLRKIIVQAQSDGNDWTQRTGRCIPLRCSLLSQFDWQTDFFEVLMPISVRVYWRWFWSSPWGYSSGHAICHLDCIVDSLERQRWLLIIYRLCLLSPP